MLKCVLSTTLFNQKKVLMMIEKKAKKIKLLILDVDGVLTDGTLYIDARGEEIKAFNVKDGFGLRMLQDNGIEVAIITGRKSSALSHRARDLGIKDVFQGKRKKGSICEELMKKKGLAKEEVCCIGDDLPDLEMFEYAGFPVAVSDAAPGLREAALYVTKNSGGKGAVRELSEIILKAQDIFPFEEKENGSSKIGFTG